MYTYLLRTTKAQTRKYLNNVLGISQHALQEIFFHPANYLFGDVLGELLLQ